MCTINFRNSKVFIEHLICAKHRIGGFLYFSFTSHYNYMRVILPCRESQGSENLIDTFAENTLIVHGGANFLVKLCVWVKFQN